jgi:ribosomal protein L11 methyltransferase
MAQTFIEYSFSIDPRMPWEDILTAELQELPFESFLITDTGLNAYVPINLHSNDFLESVSLLKHSEVKITFQTKEIAPENWNAKWESEFHPVMIGEDCVIRADFHKNQGKRYELIINPKMSFGTGHHPTTHMMMEYVLEEPLDQKTVLDMGCGTGVLGILASMKGAKNVDAIDFDPWCVENTIENANNNACSNIHVMEATSLEVKDSKYDTIFANINRNILLDQIESYSKALKPKGSLFLSGFYLKDVKALQKKCESEHLSLAFTKERETWCALKFVK